MDQQYSLNLNSLDWLLESDDTGVRYLAMRDLTRSDLDVAGKSAGKSSC